MSNVVTISYDFSSDSYDFFPRSGSTCVANLRTI